MAVLRDLQSPEHWSVLPPLFGTNEIMGLSDSHAACTYYRRLTFACVRYKMHFVQKHIYKPNFHEIEADGHSTFMYLGDDMFLTFFPKLFSSGF
jgi:hypothetical protein